MRISDWSSDVCSSDLVVRPVDLVHLAGLRMADHHARAVDAPLDALLLAHQSFGVMLGAQVGIVQALGLVEHVLAEDRSEERRVGKECVSSCRSRWLP